MVFNRDGEVKFKREKAKAKYRIYDRKPNES